MGASRTQAGPDAEPLGPEVSSPRSGWDGSSNNRFIVTCCLLLLVRDFNVPRDSPVEAQVPVTLLDHIIPAASLASSRKQMFPRPLALYHALVQGSTRQFVIPRNLVLGKGTNHSVLSSLPRLYSAFDGPGKKETTGITFHEFFPNNLVRRLCIC